METRDGIGELLARVRVIAVVGASPKPHRDSHVVAAYLQAVGYRVIPVNPGHDEILGERCYPDLGSIPAAVQIDLVDVFRRPEHVPGVVEETITRGVPALWLQLGVGHPEAERRAREAGIEVVSERCIKVEDRAHRRS